VARGLHFVEASRPGGWAPDQKHGRHARPDRVNEVSTVATAMTISAPQISTVHVSNGDFLDDVAQMADRIDRRLRMSLTPQQYAMVQDLILATRITTIARDAMEERAEPSAA
jgi:phage gp16-like protein